MCSLQEIWACSESFFFWFTRLVGDSGSDSDSGSALANMTWQFTEEAWLPM